jgi:aspartate oxidase
MGKIHVGRFAKEVATESILTEALRVTGGERQDNYGHPLANHKRIADLWNGDLAARAVDADGKRQTTQPQLDPADVVNLMILLKVARELHTSKRDNWTDIAGYARCGARIQNHE